MLLSEFLSIALHDSATRTSSSDHTENRTGVQGTSTGTEPDSENIALRYSNNPARREIAQARLYIGRWFAAEES